ncbi:UNVERIFIED_CONTAM: ABC transporter G family member 25 [Sesamum calycinum]|uniref:ABC transporter G family member 25 n=1 Tax=Sesamum calycinum TaxID=2727403 RepID=A0AAW2QMS5_9LAMI
MLVYGEASLSASAPDNSIHCSPRDSNSHHHRNHSSSPITLKFVDVSFTVKQLHDRSTNMFAGPSSDLENPTIHPLQERTILKGITGMAEPGKVLAVLGPSGSGKSTLLNALAGRLHHGHGLTGTILFNNRKLTKSIQKKTGFVSQDDVFYPHLTVRETLVFCSLLRLPSSVPKNQKIAIAESVISELGLAKCADTIIGNSFIRGVSGGERKRASIAHEMLVDPSLLILDEPTSGLDATAAYRVVATLGGLAGKGKTVVTSVHQPSSRVYQIFDELLVLSEGRCMYLGKGREAMGYFESIGFSPSFPMNPADFLLDLANGVCQLDGTTEKEKPTVRQALLSSYDNLLAPKVKAACMDAHAPIMFFPEETAGNNVKSWDTSHVSSWFNQFTILLQRNLKERKHETFNSLRIFQVMVASLLAGFMWWHSDYRDIQDRLGLLFFISIFWGVFPSFNAVFAFPQDRAIFVKERASGLGLALGALIMDAKKASTVVTVTMLAFVLTGGYYVHKAASFMSWIKYVSTTFYTYRLLIKVQYGEGKSVSSLLGCSSSSGLGGQSDGSATTCNFIDQDIRGQTPAAEHNIWKNQETVGSGWNCGEAKEALLYSYGIVSGFAAKLTPEQASRLKKEAEVTYVVREIKYWVNGHAP